LYFYLVGPVVHLEEEESDDEEDDGEYRPRKVANNINVTEVRMQRVDMKIS